ncbi:MAG: acetate--CoA ligase [Coriobacteriia bacterium]
MTEDVVGGLQRQVEGTGGAGEYPPPREFAERARISSLEQYRQLYERSLSDPDSFWGDLARQHLDWFEPFEQVKAGGFRDLDYTWFAGGKLNATHNCVDRHLSTWRRNKAAIIWEGDGGESRTYTYQRLAYEVNRFANVLKAHGLGRGDRVAMYLPMVPELAIAMLACAKLGVVHSVVFGGFSPAALRDRINDCQARMLITANQGLRAGKVVPLKANTDQALEQCPTIEKCVVVRRTRADVPMRDGRDVWWDEEVSAPGISHLCGCEAMDAEDPLFILYTSGSTGRPKGVLHTTAGYLLYAMDTFLNVFDYRDEDVYWCTADIGWITGHSYIVYGPLAAGATSLMFEGTPTYPDHGRFWDVCDKYGVNIFYTAPTAIRALMRFGEEPVAARDLSTLRLLGTVGEPINPEVWEWYHRVVGKGRCPVVDTYWQTETGGHVITPLPGAITARPGSATFPYFGVAARVVREDGSEAGPEEAGYLVVDEPWPGMLRGTWGDPEHERMREVYFSRFPGRYFTGDGAKRDADGYIWLLGRVDDVINVSGHRLGTAEIESALVSHDAVSESAVVGFPHEVKGEGIYAYVTLKESEQPSEELAEQLVGHVRNVIGPIATIDHIQFTRDLPKTRSGKIMRRILRKIAAGETSTDAFGDMSTLSDPAIVEDLIRGADRY